MRDEAIKTRIWDKDKAEDLCKTLVGEQLAWRPWKVCGDEPLGLLYWEARVENMLATMPELGKATN